MNQFQRLLFVISMLLHQRTTQGQGIPPSHPSVFSERGHPDCPCLKRDDLLKLTAIHKDENNDCLWIQEVPKAPMLCQPTEYGTKCKEWETQELCNKLATAGRCSEQWCYVNTTSCRRPKIQSTLGPAVSVSYAACGDLTTDFLIRALKGRRAVRVTQHVSAVSVPYAMQPLREDGKARGYGPDFWICWKPLLVLLFTEQPCETGVTVSISSS
eukprot:TRINITY_DN21717_c0_g1_i1.p1 TRINITY_DN21717_c0_g1~~TRINITY_DN21717_c0_g1_i1.p1  ORF type:complete len:213 (+),score=6.19 TRINITY_DN21717_c0_g1_i1:50-688(+)